MNNPLGLIALIVLLVLSFLYTDISINGVGLPVVLVLYLSITGLLVANYSDKSIVSMGLRKGVMPVAMVYIFYSLCFAAALYASGSFSSDTRFWMSHFLQFLWFPAIYLSYRYRPKAFSTALRSAVGISVIILIVSLLVGIVSSGDLLTLRNSSSFITDSGGYVLAPDILDNPNRAARSALLLLFLGMVFQFAFSRSKSSKRFWRFVTIATTVFIVLSFSRACILGMLTLWCVYILFVKNQGRNSSRINVLLIGVLFLSGVSAAAVFIPSVGDRLEQGLTSVIQARDGFNNDQVQVRDMTIRARTWAASMLIVRDNPVSGVGVSNALETLGNYGAVSSKHGYEAPVWVHGGFLKMALYGGFLTLIPMMLFLARTGYAFISLPKLMGNNSVAIKQLSWLSVGHLIATIPVNIGADSFGYSMTWFVIAAVVCVLSTRPTVSL